MFTHLAILGAPHIHSSQVFFPPSIHTPSVLAKVPKVPGAVDQGRELPRAVPHGVAHGRKAKRHVEVLS